MNIIKRSGEEVPFDSQKIYVAISKANNSVPEESRIDSATIRDITTKVTERAAVMLHTPTVEDVQEEVENALIEANAALVAKSYIKYRYKHSMIRQANTTDEAILSLLDMSNEEVKQENSNKNPTIASTQRDYMAGEVSKDLCERILEIGRAHV